MRDLATLARWPVPRNGLGMLPTTLQTRVWSSPRDLRARFESCMDGAVRALGRGDHERAEALCSRADALAPDRADTLALLAWIRAQRDRGEESARRLLPALDRALRLDPRHAPAYFYRAVLHRRIGDEESARRDYRAAASLDPRNLDAARESA